MDTIILSALVAGGTAIFTLIVNEISHYFRDRRAMKERFFYNLLPKRVEAHQEIIRKIAELSLQSLLLYDEIPNDLGDRLARAEEALKDLHNRYVTIASRDVAYLLDDLLTGVGAWLSSLDHEGSENPMDVFHRFSSFYNRRYLDLVEVARKESGVDLIDKGFHTFVKLFKATERKKVIRRHKGNHKEKD